MNYSDAGKLPPDDSARRVPRQGYVPITRQIRNRARQLYHPVIGACRFCNRFMAVFIRALLVSSKTQNLPISAGRISALRPMCPAPLRRRALTSWDAFRKPPFDYRKNRPAAAAPMSRAVMIKSVFESLPLVRSPSIFLLLPIRKIITRSGTATTPLMTAE